MKKFRRGGGSAASAGNIKPGLQALSRRDPLVECATALRERCADADIYGWRSLNKPLAVQSPIGRYPKARSTPPGHFFIGRGREPLSFNLRYAAARRELSRAGSVFASDELADYNHASGADLRLPGRCARPAFTRFRRPYRAAGVLADHTAARRTSGAVRHPYSECVSR